MPWLKRTLLAVSFSLVEEVAGRRQEAADALAKTYLAKTAAMKALASAGLVVRFVQLGPRKLIPS